MDTKELLRDGVQATLAVVLTGAVIYLTIVGKMDTDIIAGLAGMAIAFYLAERKNGKERDHEANMHTLRSADDYKMEALTRQRRRR